MRLVVEIEGEDAPRALAGGGGTLVALMSFAVMRGFGAQHALIALADRLHDTHHVPLGGLTTFYDATIEDAEDREKLALAWQPASDVVRPLEGLLAALETDEQARALVQRAGGGDLAGEATELLGIARTAESAHARLRLSYEL